MAIEAASSPLQPQLGPECRICHISYDRHKCGVQDHVFTRRHILAVHKQVRICVGAWGCVQGCVCGAMCEAVCGVMCGAVCGDVCEAECGAVSSVVCGDVREAVCVVLCVDLCVGLCVRGCE